VLTGLDPTIVTGVGAARFPAPAQAWCRFRSFADRTAGRQFRRDHTRHFRMDAAADRWLIVSHRDRTRLTGARRRLTQARQWRAGDRAGTGCRSNGRGGLASEGVHNMFMLLPAATGRGGKSGTR